VVETYEEFDNELFLKALKSKRFGYTQRTRPLGQLRKSAMVDWLKRESVRAPVRNLVRWLLRRWKYPPDAAEKAIKLVLEQAEILADEWYQ